MERVYNDTSTDGNVDRNSVKPLAEELKHSFIKHVKYSDRLNFKLLLS